MNRMETIGAVAEMFGTYSKFSDEMRQKYAADDDIPQMGRAAHKRIVNQACAIAEKTIKFELPEEYVTNALIFFGICMDAQKHHLDWSRAREDLQINMIASEVKKRIDDRRKETRDLLEKADKMIGEEEWKDIQEKYRLNKPWDKSVSENWHRIIVGTARKLALNVVERGGTMDEIRTALMYFKVCVDVNKCLLDYVKFQNENGIVELSKKYGVVKK